MLRITQQQSPEAAKRYHATADYYREGQEVVGNWGGDAARMLGLRGLVDQDAFDRLCDNLHPRTGRPLTARTRSDRTVGYDFTFSVPKSVSLLYALTDDSAVAAAFRAAVGETMREIEAEMKARVRKGGRDVDRDTGNMVWAEFVHRTSRPVDDVPDPQLHAHCFAFNATWDAHERQWKAGQFRDLKRDAPYFQAAFRVRLANKLQDLGFGIVRTRDDFEIAGVPAGVLKRYSRRTEQVERVAAERGITDPDRKAELGAKTRERKGTPLAWDALRETWAARLSPAERDGLGRVGNRETSPPRPARGERAAVDYALDHCFAREAVVPERKLLTEALKRGLGAVTVRDAARELYTRPLIRGDHGGRAVATTPAMLDAESRLIAFARGGRGRFRPLADADRPLVRDWLNAGQKAAVRHVLGSRDRVTIVRGAAGTGKTKLEEELRDAFRERGVPVVALAQSADASRGVLRDEAGFADADTVARFLVNTGMQDRARNGVVLVDEASQLGTRDLLRVFDVADTIGARIVLVGDRRQHRAVAAGEPLALLEEKAGLPVAEVTDIIRQSGDYKKATKALSRGDIATGFAELDRLKWIKEVPDCDRDRVLAAAYLAAVAERKANGERKTALVVSPTHAEAGRVTRAVRDGLKAAGRLGAERVIATWRPAHLTDAQKADPTQYEAGDLLRFHQHAPGHKSGSRLILGAGATPPVGSADRFEVYRPAPLAVAVGDRLRVTAGGTTRDGKHRLDTGAVFTVKGFTRRGDVVDDRGWVIDREFGHLAHGYVVTSHASQGRTVDKVFVAQSGESFAASNRRQFYVSVSRGREQAVVFTDDKAQLLAAAARADDPLSATALAESRRRPPSLRQRLYKHLAFVRRMGTFARTHEIPSTHFHREMTQQHHQERGHER
ncbi:MobF family relaxase [Fimbriiglobus ruber]|uniref:IncW plasmid conjugative relaxase protein TrwC (TraI) n=1 Tax=Fimbriiglobus ruber TaxID=1908690 RepID=A0A225DJ14_9BACT|nr:MobF family relaxase [Fimbriiglobus ruber]OWK40973.1 IncW plasmid conjugative relaxase protein TrwC (TraI) [Fimbriiglobus ruber]